jgi:membrane protease YdiL (CAAX protease family)
MAMSSEKEIGWTARDIGRSLLIGIVLGLGVSIIAGVLIVLVGLSLGEPIPVSVVTMVFYAGFFCGAYLPLRQRRGLSIIDVGFVPAPVRTLVLMVPVYIAMVILVGLVITATAPLVGQPPTTEQQLELSQNASLSSGVETALLFVAIALVVPFVEEFFFRGLIYRYLRARKSAPWAVLISAGLFAVAHPYIPLMPAIFVIGAVLALVVERYRSLYPAVVLHTLTNGVAVLLVAAS